ncbi:MAG TPA: CoA pyrophosphatase [Pirellulaceae bacterium]|nr:CoA pyrophosphatase [Pirellulaceae bacterium]
MSAAATAIDLAQAPAGLTAALRERLQKPLPGLQAYRKMAPELAYGRHSGPPALDAREAAVLVLLYLHDGAWRLPAMLRPSEMKFHAGQIALPGGVVEPDESPYETALRELSEELGVPHEGLCVLGALHPIYVFNSNFWIKPFLAVAHERPEFALNPTEAAELIEIPVPALLNPTLRGEHRIERRGLAFRAPHYRIGPHCVWGATSLILAELAALFGGQ